MSFCLAEINTCDGSFQHNLHLSEDLCSNGNIELQIPVKENYNMMCLDVKAAEDGASSRQQMLDGLGHLLLCVSCST